ncbi:Eyes absent 1 [Nymphon striatum]|nr:Eyes absent 1 [Nymphon striatum]
MVSDWTTLHEPPIPSKVCVYTAEAECERPCLITQWEHGNVPFFQHKSISSTQSNSEVVQMQVYPTVGTGQTSAYSMNSSNTTSSGYYNGQNNQSPSSYGVLSNSYSMTGSRMLNQSAKNGQSLAAQSSYLNPYSQFAQAAGGQMAGQSPSTYTAYGSSGYNTMASNAYSTGPVPNSQTFNTAQQGYTSPYVTGGSPAIQPTSATYHLAQIPPIVTDAISDHHHYSLEDNPSPPLKTDGSKPSGRKRSGRGPGRKQNNPSPEPENQLERVYIWDLDETLIIFHSLLTTAYPKKYGKVKFAELEPQGFITGNLVEERSSDSNKVGLENILGKTKVMFNRNVVVIQLITTRVGPGQSQPIKTFPDFSPLVKKLLKKLKDSTCHSLSDEHIALDLGVKMEQLIFDLADSNLFFTDLEDVDQIHIDDVSSDDNGQDLTNYNFQADGLTNTNTGNPGFCLGAAVRGGVDCNRKIAFRYRKIKEIYNKNRNNCLLAPAQNELWYQVRQEVEKLTDSKEDCFQKVRLRFGKCTYVALGDGTDERTAAKNRLSYILYPTWRNIHSDMHYHPVPTTLEYATYASTLIGWQQINIEMILQKLKNKLKIQRSRTIIFNEIRSSYGPTDISTFRKLLDLKKSYYRSCDKQDTKFVHVLDFPFWPISSHSDLITLHDALIKEHM